VSGYWAAFAPGGAFAFTSDTPNGVRIRIAATPRAQPRTLPTAGEAWAPSLSPDGSALVFTSDVDWGRRAADADWAAEIHSIDSDGSGERRLTRNRVWNGYPAVSPDGTTIAFDTGRFGWDEAELMDTNGSHQRRLTRQLGGNACCPVWRPADALGR
jgi:Tol biopolymer transport system component